MNTKDKILEIISEHKEVRVNDIQEFTGVSRQMIHRALKDLIHKNIVVKLGTPPRTFYKLEQGEKINVITNLEKVKLDFLEEHYIIITEVGKKLIGIEGMIYWCERHQLPVEKTCNEYIITRKRYLSYFESIGLINGTEKIKNTKGFDKIGLDNVWYLDFYAIERFGKTKLGILLHFAKQGQNRKLMKEIIDLIRSRIQDLISKGSIQAVGFIPPTIRREVQIMSVLQKGLNLPLPHVDLKKVTGEIAIPQKALSKISDRIGNAKASIMVSERRKFETILLIDDAIGSGATLNETAIKLKERGNATYIIGLAVTGSYKGFEVIHEV